MNSSLFNLSSARPTAREVALVVRSKGKAGLVNAVRRGDEAHYQEIVCKSALNRTKQMPFGWTLNPYRGCTHGCHYCFARRYHAQFELSPGDEFSSVILVKINFPEVLRRELSQPTWKKELIAFGTATDPYQPIEGHYKLTRRSLEAMITHSTPVGLITKGTLITRDSDLLVELSRLTRCTVYMSVPTVDEDAWRVLEPGTAHPLQRLRTVRKLNDAGVKTGVLMAPVVPGLTSHPAKLERTVKAIADHGAYFMTANLLHLEGGTRAHFLEFLSRKFPQLVSKYHRLYAGKYAAPVYTEQIRAVLDTLQTRHGFNRHRKADKTPATEQKTVIHPTQQALFQKNL